MDDDTTLVLSGQQRAIYQALARMDDCLASMYYGALLVLKQELNPERFCLAAHSMRELMDRMSRPLDVCEPAARKSLKAETQNLSAFWTGARSRTSCHRNGKWDGPVDPHLRKLLVRLSAFFEWFNKEHPIRKQRTASLLRRLDPLSAALPRPIERLHVDEWDLCHDRLTRIAHHEDPSDFEQWHNALERLLVDKLCPRTFAEQDIIDTIIQEGEQGA